MASTNVIESAFSIVEKVCKNVKRWHGGDQRERWVWDPGSLVAENQFRRITGYKLIPILMQELKGVDSVQIGCSNYAGAVTFNGTPGVPGARPGKSRLPLTSPKLNQITSPEATFSATTNGRMCFSRSVMRHGCH